MADTDIVLSAFPISGRKTLDITATQAMDAIKSLVASGLTPAEITAALLKIGVNETDISTLTTAVGTNTTDISTLRTDVDNNDTDIATLQSDVAALEDLYYFKSFYQDTLKDSELLYVEKMASSILFQTGLTNSSVYAAIASTGAVSIDIQKNDVSIGTIDFAIGANDATFTFASDQTFAIGDILKLVAPGTADATLADVSISLRGEVQ